MHSLDILEYGHQMVLNAVSGFTEHQATKPGVCGEWSVKDILAHLTSYEAVLVDVLTSLTEKTSTPVMDRWIVDSMTFNDVEVAQRRYIPMEDLIAEYRAYHDVVIDQLLNTPEDKLREAGALPWYGAAYDVEDFIVYAFYGHKREHCAQIEVYRDRIAKIEAMWEAQLDC
ncbi:MAG: DinB family protein [Anaerolineae bacterium]|nr:DinB family protein [Anaerolineae bacterium]